jgi:2-oxoisovalerate dehydrogenase E2 component (dihydrolipoyl transacylase)
MVEINTDKVDAEVPSPVTGVLVEILAPEGAVVPVGANIAVIDVDDVSHAAVAGTAVAAVPTSASSAIADEAAVAGLQSAATTRADRATDRQNVKHAVEGGGPSALPSAQVQAGDESALLTPVRRRIAEAMTLSKSTIPHAWQVQEIDMTGVAMSIAANRGAVRRRHSAALTYVPYVLAAVAAATRQHPGVNATFAGDRIIIHREINIGVAVGLPTGVIVPVVSGADRLSITELAVAVTALTARARDKTLKPDDLAGATITVNNSGALGTLMGYSVITPGQSAIATMGAVVERPIVVDGQVVIRRMMYLCLSLDHRVMDGLEAAAFLGACRQWLEAVATATALE